MCEACRANADLWDERKVCGKSPLARQRRPPGL